MKKYVDLSPLYIDKSDAINEEQAKIKGWRKWLVFFIIMLILSIPPMFYFSFEDLLLMLLVAAYSLVGICTSLSFIKMYKGSIKDWEEFEVKSNNGWKELEDKHNKDWNRHFEEARNSDYYTEESTKDSEQNVINRSKKNVRKLLDDRE